MAVMRQEWRGQKSRNRTSDRRTAVGRANRYTIASHTIDIWQASSPGLLLYLLCSVFHQGIKYFTQCYSFVVSRELMTLTLHNSCLLIPAIPLAWRCSIFLNLTSKQYWPTCSQWVVVNLFLIVWVASCSLPPFIFLNWTCPPQSPTSASLDFWNYWWYPLS